MAYSDGQPTPALVCLPDMYLTDERHLARDLVTATQLSDADRGAIREQASAMAGALRKAAQKPSIIDAFLQEYSLSSEEGILLMRLSESLVRTPDTSTATRLLRDKLLAGDWSDHFGARHALVKLGTAGLAFAKVWIKVTGGVAATNLLAKLGDRVMLSAVRQAVGLLGRHFVLGTSIANAARRASGTHLQGSTLSYDMLGEAALTQADADRYFDAYKRALQHLVDTTPTGTPLHDAPALSVKLSALHPRYEYNQRHVCVPALTRQLLELCTLAKGANLGLTIDAEEADRLEVSLLVFERLLASDETNGWDGLGLAVQAYQRRAISVLDWLSQATQSHRQKITVRLVKGAYWDSEIKRAQELGLESYPVFTRKEHTDISYLACARKLLEGCDWIYPQFATHNAHSAAAITHMAGAQRNFEFQRLYGMSDGLHQILAEQHGFRIRTYAPVGRHKDLLPYLVRRLLENGANNSFVNQLLDPTVSDQDLVSDPITEASTHDYTPHPKIHAPRDHFDGRRLAATGLDLTQSDIAGAAEETPLPVDLKGFGLINGAESSGPAQAITSPTRPGHRVGTIRENRVADIPTALQACAASAWPQQSPAQRASVLRRAADLLEQDKSRLMALCVAEAGKIWVDADAEIREAVDFLHYYANQAERDEIARLAPLGPVACISPWNFPLAIFLGQVSAALAVGNTVLAKPAEQTPFIAYEAVKLLHAAGVPEDALHLLVGDGKIGAALVSAPAINGVCFTGSTQTAKRIAGSLADTGRGTVPLIAETGGINAMVIDSTALLEQAVKDVIDSAFQSAGQRCSACRIVCVQDDIAEAFNTMLAGAVAELETGDPAALRSDLGPVIDQQAKAHIETHIAAMRQRFAVVAEGASESSPDGTFVTPIAFELNQISDLEEEIFGPVLHIVRYPAARFDQVIEDINALGFGLTMGLHTRMDTRIDHVAARARVGNLYVNRNQIGAVVGVQPFGGRGMSGTGPKAGGPNYLARLCQRPDMASPETTELESQLPGPTGEDNRLSYHPRGKLLCLGGDTPEILDQQIERVQATGNTPLTIETLDPADLKLPDDIDGVLVEGALRALVAERLAHRDGPILPLLSVEDADSRFWIEKTVTVNTTAAGGNASLLAEI
ncbi:MAG: bifunctional proline dehydrogenase/L-glutamate gamma-semialdehyde dehydrogenase PutA [Hyphomonadaceae bacterium]|nr:bifunctional proline dehydrogenase/L-glutamate gamma-semialdehyde dehydrogenase PutA [Hyphomonadaceae bacterium]